MTAILSERASKYYSLIGKMLIVRHNLQSGRISTFGDIQNVILNEEVNVASGEESSFRKLQKTIQEISKQVTGLVTIDYEGSRICRWGHDMPSVPGAYALSLTPDELEEAGEIMGKQLTALGVDMVLGPVVDNGGPRSAFPSRCYGETADEIIQRVELILHGLNKYVFTCLKHYPNHGAVEADSHEKLPTSLFDLRTFELNYLPQFKILAQRADAIMTAHIFAKKWDEENPATFSKTILNWLSDKGINNIIITDSLTMGAVEEKYGGEFIEVAIAAIRAGANMLITGSQSIDQVKELLEQLTQKAVRDQPLRRLIKVSAKKIDDLMAKRRPKIESDEIAPLTEQALRFATRVAERVLFSKMPLIHARLIHSAQTMVLAPRLIAEKVSDGYQKAFSEAPNIIFWDGISPTKEEIEMIAHQVSAMQDIVVVTYNGDRDSGQQELVHTLSSARVRICESNFAHEQMCWAPSHTDALCTYSADPVSLSIAFKKFAKGNQ